MIEFNFQNIIFLDIETVPQYPDYQSVPDAFKKLWDKKAERLFDEQHKSPDEVYHKAGIFSEFGKIICVSVGYMYNNTLRVKSFYSDDNEAELLSSFADMIEKQYSKNLALTLCAHNGKEFDFPYLARRMLLNGIRIPTVLNVAGKKPWEINHIDTMELWKFGDYKNYTSLNLLTYIFDIPTPKDDIDGSMVCDVFYKDKDLDRIVRYCEKDVIAIAQLLRKYNYLALIPDANIEIV